MAWFRCGGSGIPASLKSGMNAVLNKKFGTSTTYDPSGWPADVNLMGPLPVKTASGAIASFADGADGVPVKSCVVSFLPSGGGGTPSAPVAITGVSGVAVTQLGKNLLNIGASVEEPNPTTLNVSPRTLGDFKWFKGLRSDNYYYPNYVTYSVSGGAITVTNTSSSNAYGMSYCFPIRPSTVFTVSLACDSTPLYSVGYFDENWNFLGTSSSSYQVTSQTITAHSEAYHAILTLRAPQNTPKTYSSVQIEVGSTATTYSAYVTPSVVTDTFGQTIYGGTRDLTTDKASVTWGYIASYNGETLTGRWVSSMDTYVAGTTPTTGAEVAYELATPTEITGLTPHADISTLLGDNNVYADTGTTEVEYRADIDLALNA